MWANRIEAILKIALDILISHIHKDTSYKRSREY